MTKEEIKQEYSMRDILAKCGLSQPNRAGFIPCPFHKGDREPSMKIYDKDYHCFGCGANGDVFTFIEQFYNLTFREAFEMLGGVYEKPSYKTKLAIYQAKKAQSMRQKKEQNKKAQRKLNNDLISIYRRYVEQTQPLSEVWCDCYNALQYQVYKNEYLNEMR